MKIFGVIDSEGWLLRFGSCNEDLFESQAKEGETAIVLNSRPVLRRGKRFKLVDGNLIQVATEEQ